MAEGGTVNILGEIQFLVSDKLQVVSYKWLSRNFSVSSNDAKRLLQEFIEKHGSRLEVVYTLSGWLEKNPQMYQIRLVSGVKLSEVKQEFEDNCSVQIYSVQACIPKDSASLWSAEFVQAEELFDQPSDVDNCLRDNRFCGVSNSFVKRNPDGNPAGVAPQPKNGFGVAVPSKTIGVHVPPVPQPKKGQVEQCSPKLGQQSSAVVTRDDQTESNAPAFHAQTSKVNIGKEEVTMVPANKKKGQNEKSSSGTGASLANLWGRASAKSKPSCPPMKITNDVPNPVVTAEAQICAREALDDGSSDDEGKDINYKRDLNGESSRKRRVVFDFSDDEDDYENVVSLASPDPPKKEPNTESKCKTENLVLEKKDLNFGELKGKKSEIKQEKATESISGSSPKEDLGGASKGKTSEGLNEKSKTGERDSAASTSPKRRKVLKTRIDERGREVTDVVWEGEVADKDKTDKKAITNSTENRPPATKKAPASASTAPSNPVGKAGNKKTSKAPVKDAKQGSLLSFFKKA
ncbi:DNA-directed DNA polymerase [Tasmannia lanceolata]|uniref:DNA-directed DNA polymerase n=1 Tax=Tasmannia lanceolata TaxID=3420 RepID=UPI004063516D